jgi:Tol biopolymer transport system component
MNVDGGSQARLTPDTEWDYDPTWSPDGTKIAFTHGGTGANIFTMNPDGSTPTTLTRSNLDGHATASWPPDGSRIAFLGLVGEKQRDLNLLFFQTSVEAWPAEAQIKVIDRRCNITYTSNKINLASIF